MCLLEQSCEKQIAEVQAKLKFTCSSWKEGLESGQSKSSSGAADRHRGRGGQHGAMGRSDHHRDEGGGGQRHGGGLILKILHNISWLISD